MLTTHFKFGTASLLFTATAAQRLSLDGSADFAFGAGDYTVDLWVYFNTVTAGVNLYDSRALGGSGFYPAIFISTNKLALFMNSSTVITGATTVSPGTWHHVALTRSGSNTKLFLNGTQEGSTYVNSTSLLVGASRPFIGNSGAGTAAVSLDGWMDEIRVVKGTAVWTANFTPPSSPYTS